MPKQKCHKNQDNGEPANLPLAFFACPNSDCADFNHFDANNLSIAEGMGQVHRKRLTVGLLKNPVSKKTTRNFRPESGLKFSLRHFFNSPTVPNKPKVCYTETIQSVVRHDVFEKGDIEICL